MASNTPAPGRLTGQDVVFALDRGYRAPLVLRGVVSVAVAGIAALLAAAGFLAPVTWIVAVVFGAAGLLQALLYLWQGRFRTRLSMQGIEARGYFDHFIAWSDVTGIDVREFPASEATIRRLENRPRFPLADGFWAKLATVRVARRGGRRRLLRAPLVTSWQDDPEFGDKARLIRQWWRDYGQGPAGQLP